MSKCTAIARTTGKRCSLQAKTGRLLCGQHAHLLTTREVADEWGVTDRTVREWIRQGLPVIRAGRQGSREAVLDPETVGTWVDRRTAEDADLATAMIRKLDADAARTARGLEALAGRYLPEALVHGSFRVLISDLQRQLGGVPRELAPRLVRAANKGVNDVEAEMNRFVRDLLLSLAAADLTDELERVPETGGVPKAPPVTQSASVREARAQLVTLQALVIETKNRIVGHETPRPAR